MSATDLSARDRILVTAHDLFYRDGIRATGVDRLIAESGVAKLTFYRHFPSKDALVRTFLDYRHERWMAWFIDALGRHGAQAGGGLQPLGAAMAEWFGDPVFRGCAFINAVAEVGGSLADVPAIAQRHKLDMQALIADLLPAMPGDERKGRAEAAALAVDGAIVRAQMDGPLSSLAGLQRLLRALDAPSPPSSRRAGPDALTTMAAPASPRSPAARAGRAAAAGRSNSASRTARANRLTPRKTP